MRAEALLPDHLDQRDFDGVAVRKGTVGAFLLNAQVFLDPAASAEDRGAAERDIAEAVPALQALGLFGVLQIRDEKLRAFVDARVRLVSLAGN